MKLILSLIGKNKEDILQQIETSELEHVSIVELRLDTFAHIHTETIIDEVQEIKESIEDRQLLITLRSEKEGGYFIGSDEEYANIYRKLIAFGICDYVDVEMNKGQQIVNEIVRVARKAQVQIIISHHSFEMLTIDEMKRCLLSMSLLGDISKLAVMSHNAMDTARILQVSAMYQIEHPDNPFCIIAMGEIGKASRVFGKEFGSSYMYVCLKKPIVAGQISLTEFNQIQQILKK